MPEESAFGHDETSKQAFYGLRGHLRVCGDLRVSLAPADAYEFSVAEELLEGGQEGWPLGDRTGIIGAPSSPSDSTSGG